MGHNRDEKSPGLKRVDKHIDKMRDRMNTAKGQLKALGVDIPSAVAGRVQQRAAEWTKASIEVY